MLKLIQQNLSFSEMLIHVDLGDRVKIDEINFIGNEYLQSIESLKRK